MQPLSVRLLFIPVSPLVCIQQNFYSMIIQMISVQDIISLESCLARNCCFSQMGCLLLLILADFSLYFPSCENVICWILARLVTVSNTFSWSFFILHYAYTIYLVLSEHTHIFIKCYSKLSIRWRSQCWGSKISFNNNLFFQYKYVLFKIYSWQ